MDTTVIRDARPEDLTAESDATVLGAGYLAPEPFSDRCWNLYFLVVDPGHHGRGVGSRIVAEVEAD